MPHSDHLIHKVPKKRTSAFDKVVLVVSVLYPLSALPQAYDVMTGKSEGVSVISWMGFLACAILFMIYGYKHKVLPMIISNTLWIVVDALVVIGILT
jgi:uncharacterized protein with PQ loop repeat